MRLHNPAPRAGTLTRVRGSVEKVFPQELVPREHLLDR